MITSIRIQNEASYGCEPQDLEGLSKHNFLFGANGTGKTTISKIIADESAYPHCSVTWLGTTKLRSLVYNRDFVRENFDQPSALKGIFTLGEANREALFKIETAKSELDDLRSQKERLRKQLDGESGSEGKRWELRELESAFTSRCWVLKKKYDDMFREAFEGCRGKKTAFRDKLLTEAKSNSGKLRSLAELKLRAETVFGEDPQLLKRVLMPQFDELLRLEVDPLLQKKIIGRTDVDIAAVIEKLGNSDWVSQGRTFYDANDTVCPFCQQSTGETLSASLGEYFDMTFEGDIKALANLNAQYSQLCVGLIEDLQQKLVAPSEFLDDQKLKSEMVLLQAAIQMNLQRIQMKRDEPSRCVELDTLSEQLTRIEEMIESANRATEEHNRVVTNLCEEKRDLTNQVWKFLVGSEIKGDCTAYIRKRDGLVKGIDSISNKINERSDDMRAKEAEIAELEKVTTSIQPTIDGINDLLASFGFTNFTLAKSTQERFYSIVRSDGTDAKETLSEGEKNFIAFLYFYHLLKGSDTESGVTTDRIVVFDDPVSSLDSNVLFIVSTLIKSLFEEVRTGEGNIKQIFVLTHNVFFHKEVSYKPNRRNDDVLNEETFWIVWKSNDLSMIERHYENPVKTSYDLLWMEVRSGTRSNLSIQNTLRRILESYFRIQGGVNIDKLCAQFEGMEKLVCRSLISWVHAGSHFEPDDLFVSGDSKSIEVYLRVFRKVFEKKGHGGHYRMMMQEGGEESNSERHDER